MPAHDLPRLSTAFIGRNAELADITNRLANPACRLLTLTGAGGIGKTRLALEVAHLLETDYPDGVFFISLQPLTSPDFILTTIIAALELVFMGDQDPKVQLLKHLRDKNMLLVLDNFEHLIAGADLLPDMLEAATNLKLLVTSRERLSLREEWVLDVSGLTFPAKGQTARLDAFSATQLFLGTAHRAGLIPAESDTPSIVRICQLVEGIPLAIELAASWIRVMPCPEIVREIERGLDILTTNVRNVPEKHRSMRTAFEHSWKLLPETEQRVFCQLSVFRGGFRREAAEGVAGASLSVLASLVDRSLLRLDANGRYSFQELLRQYAAYQLESSGETKAARDAHCAYYVSFLCQREADLKGANQIRALDEIASEMDNIRVSWQWAVQERKEVEISQALDALTRYYQIRSHYREGAEMFELALNAFAETQNRDLLAEIYLWHGWFHHYRNNLSKEFGSIQKGVALQREAEHYVPIAIPLRQLIFWTDELDGYDTVLQFYQERLTAARNNGDTWGTAWMLHCIGELAARHERPLEAQPFLHESVHSFRAIHDRWGSSWSISALAMTYQDLQKFPEALRYQLEHQALCEEVGDIAGVAYALSRRGRMLESLGETKAFMRYFDDILKLAVQSGYVLWIVGTLEWAVCQMIEDGKAEDAVDLLGTLLSQDIGAHFRKLMTEQLDQMKANLPSDVFSAALLRGQAASLEAQASSMPRRFAAVEEESPPLLPALQSEEGLTERELEILRLIADGLNSREVAKRLHLGVTTIRWYLRQIYSKLDVHTRSEALARARSMKLLV